MVRFCFLFIHVFSVKRLQKGIFPDQLIFVIFTSCLVLLPRTVLSAKNVLSLLRIWQIIINCYTVLQGPNNGWGKFTDLDLGYFSQVSVQGR